MSEIIDNVAKALASGLPRRQALRWAGGLAALTPFGEAAAHNRFKPVAGYCQDWRQSSSPGRKPTPASTRRRRAKGRVAHRAGEGRASSAPRRIRARPITSAARRSLRIR
jgi:hypothetical protein